MRWRWSFSNCRQSHDSGHSEYSFLRYVPLISAFPFWHVVSSFGWWTWFTWEESVVWNRQQIKLDDKTVVM